MPASIEDAYKKAIIAGINRSREQSHHLSQVVEEWSADDNVHIDPPLQNQPATSQPQENQVDYSNLATASPTPEAPKTNFGRVLTGVSKATFEYIRDNPGATRADVIKALAEQGYKAGSVSSLVGQLVVQRVAFMDPVTTALTTNLREYQPLKSGAVRKLLTQARHQELARTDPRKAAGYKKMVASRKKARKAKFDKQDELAKETVKTKQRERAAMAREALAEKRAKAHMSAEEKIAARKESDRKRHAAKRAEMKAAHAAAQAKLGLVSGVDIDAVQKQTWADMVERPVQQTQPHVDLRDMVPAAIVDAMNLRQAHAVYKALFEIFGAL